MNRTVLCTTAGTVLVLLAGCGSGPRIMDADDTSSNPRSMRQIVSEDWVEISRKGSDALLASPVFDNYLQAYREDAESAYIKAHPGAAVPASVRRATPLLMLSVIRNNTDEHINTQLMTERISERLDRKSTRLNSSHCYASRMPSSA